MGIAVFFQKNSKNNLCRILNRLYILFFVRTNESRVRYLRDAGARIGENVNLGSIDMIGTEPWLVSIGNNVYFSGNGTILLTHDGGIPYTYRMGIAPKRYDSFGRISIGNNCFIGINSIILKGVTIGDNCVIGAGSIVTKDVPSGSVACGIPAKVIKTTVEYFEQSKDHLDDTIGLNAFEKRRYMEEKYKDQK